MDQIYIFIALALLLAFILFKEIKRENKSNRILRILASIFAIIALFFIASPIKYKRQVSDKETNIAILLTEGYHKDSLASWKGRAIFTTEKEIAEKNKNVKHIGDLNEFLSSNPKFEIFHVYGYGLENHEFESLKDKNLIFHPSVLADGISSINWSKKIRSGEELLIQGSYNNLEKREIKLVLQGMGTNLDSVIIEKESTSFELKCIPKHLDKAVYSLIALANGDTLAKEDLPILVKAKEPMRILILAASPDFEHKFLKNWLSEQGYSLAIRTTISTNKFNSEFLNGLKIDLTRINSTLLNDFDVLIGDIQELARLSNAESQALQNQVNLGMGLIIKTDAIESGSGFYKKAFSLQENKKVIPKTMNLTWNGQEATKNILQGSTLLSIMPQSGTQSLVKNESGDILISSKLLGKGRIVLSLINDSYTWVLGNQLNDYSSFWTYILQKAGKKKESSVNYILPQIPILDQELQLSSDSSQLNINNDQIALIQDPILQFEQRGSWWPKNTGWQPIDNEQEWIYVFDKSAWRGVRAAEKTKNTKKRWMREKKESIEEKFANSIYEDQFSAIWFYILFLLCCTYLWLEEKLS
ncbi:hypothetical protein [Daejeonella sp.]|uniref:hypothetical protein n=1 Tax=Daejeonella sp. TaxID=2805397 RepID=UPI0025C5169A|nr:hypothetical protein [Daejeonella sp.]